MATVFAKAIVVYPVAPVALVILFMGLCLKFNCTGCKESSLVAEQFFPFA